MKGSMHYAGRETLHPFFGVFDVCVRLLEWSESATREGFQDKRRNALRTSTKGRKALKQAYSQIKIRVFEKQEARMCMYSHRRLTPTGDFFCLPV